MPFITFRDYCHLRGMSTYVIFKRRLVTCQWVSIDDTHMFCSIQLAFKHCRKWSSHQCFNIRWSLNFATGNGNNTSKVYFSRIKQAAKKDYSCRIYCPNNLSLIDRSNMIDLYTNISYRAFPLENIDFNILSTNKRGCCLLLTYPQVSLLYL